VGGHTSKNGHSATMLMINNIVKRKCKIAVVFQVIQSTRVVGSAAKTARKKRGAENPEIPPILLKTNGQKMSLWRLATISMITQVVTHSLPRYA
jgi:hypothetical protein